jgi:hypothetical protein
MTDCPAHTSIDGGAFGFPNHDPQEGLRAAAGA